MTFQEFKDILLFFLLLYFLADIINMLPEPLKSYVINREPPKEKK